MFQSTFGADNYLAIVFHSEHFIWVLNEENIFLPEWLYSPRDTVCKLKYSQKLSKRNRFPENLIEEPLLLRPRSTVLKHMLKNVKHILQRALNEQNMIKICPKWLFVSWTKHLKRFISLNFLHIETRTLIKIDTEKFKLFWRFLYKLH